MTTLWSTPVQPTASLSSAFSLTPSTASSGRRRSTSPPSQRTGLLPPAGSPRLTGLYQDGTDEIIGDCQPRRTSESGSSSDPPLSMGDPQPLDRNAADSLDKRAAHSSTATATSLGTSLACSLPIDMRSGAPASEGSLSPSSSLHPSPLTPQLPFDFVASTDPKKAHLMHSSSMTLDAHLGAMLSYQVAGLNIGESDFEEAHTACFAHGEEPGRKRRRQESVEPLKLGSPFDPAPRPPRRRRESSSKSTSSTSSKDSDISSEELEARRKSVQSASDKLRLITSTESPPLQAIPTFVIPRPEQVTHFGLVPPSFAPVAFPEAEPERPPPRYLSSTPLLQRPPPPRPARPPPFDEVPAVSHTS